MFVFGRWISLWYLKILLTTFKDFVDHSSHGDINPNEMFKEHLRSPLAFRGVRVTRSLVLCVFWKGRLDHVRIWSLDLQLPIQSVPSTTNVVSSKFVHGEV
jgi:hypothetical protein